MLGAPLSSREWKIPASSGTCKELMAAYMAEAKAANRPVTKNQKKKLKRKFKKQLSQAQQPGASRSEDDNSAACLDEPSTADERKNGTSAVASGVAEAQECSMVWFSANRAFPPCLCHFVLHRLHADHSHSTCRGLHVVCISDGYITNDDRTWTTTVTVQYLLPVPVLQHQIWCAGGFGWTGW